MSFVALPGWTLNTPVNQKANENGRKRGSQKFGDFHVIFSHTDLAGNSRLRIENRRSMDPAANCKSK